MTRESADAMVEEAAPESVLGMLREQASLFSKLESFAARQKSLVAENDPGELLSVLADRQKVSIDLTELSARLAPVRREWSSFRRRLSAVQLREADGLVATAMDRLRRVLDGDEQDARLLSVRKQMVAGELRMTHSTARAVEAYGAPVRSFGAERLDETT